MITSPPVAPPPGAPAPPRPNLIGPGTTLREMVDAYERNVILIALSAVGGNQRRAARLLGLLPSTLNEKMRKFRIRSADQSNLAIGGVAPRAVSREGEDSNEEGTPTHAVLPAG